MAPGHWPGVAMTAWHPLPCWTGTGADGPLGSSCATSPGHRGQMSIWEVSGHTAVLPHTVCQPHRALFSRVVLGPGLGQGGLSRLGPLCGGSIRARSAPGSSVAMTMLRLGLGPSITACPSESFSSPWGLNS